MSDDTLKQTQDWWRTDIIDMKPGEIRLRGYPIEQLIGEVSFVETIWLMLRGELPTRAQGELLTAALVAGVDHGPQAPVIAIARMAITCGVGLNNAMASATNVLGDVHGGAGEQAVELYGAIAKVVGQGKPVDAAVAETLATYVKEHGRFIPGFGHRFHPVDPRAPRLLELVDRAAAAGVVTGEFAKIGRAIETHLARGKGKNVPMNIDGATAVIFAELGFPPPLARGLFVLSRSVGVLAHVWEQSGRSERNKGPTPPDMLYTYGGQAPRKLADRR